MQLVTKCSLGIYELKEYNLMVFRMGEWQYSINKDIPVMT